MSNETTFFDVISLIVTVISMVFLASQVMDARKAYEKEHERKSKEKAIDMAQYFVLEILPKASIIAAIIYDNKNFEEFIHKINQHHNLDFTSKESHELFSDSEVVKYQDMIYAEETIKLLGAIRFETDNEARERGKITITKTEVNEIITGLLNSLEYFSMFIRYNLIDDMIIYQSLHQVYLSTVRGLYLEIARLNTTGKDKYFTNIIETFNKWDGIYLLKCNEEKELQYNTSVKSNKFSI